MGNDSVGVSGILKSLSSTAETKQSRCEMHVTTMIAMLSINCCVLGVVQTDLYTCSSKSLKEEQSTRVESVACAFGRVRIKIQGAG